MADVDTLTLIGLLAPWVATAVAVWQVFVTRKQTKADLKKTQEALSVLRDMVEVQKLQINQLANSSQAWQTVQQQKQNLQAAKMIGGVLKFFWEEGFFD